MANDLDLNKFYTSAVYKNSDPASFRVLWLDKFYVSAVYKSSDYAVFRTLWLDKLYTSAVYRFQPTPGITGSDQYFGNVVLLCGFNDADGSTAFIDESGYHHALTANGDAQIDTAQFKFNGSSALFDGTGDYVSSADSVDWVFGTGQYTVECWVRFNALTVTASHIVGQYGANGSRAWALRASTSGANTLEWVASTDGVNNNNGVVVTSVSGLTTGVWHHIAADRDAANKVRLYLNGVMIGSLTGSTGSIQDSTSLLTIGRADNVTNPFPLNGWVDEVRITKDVARYASDSGFAVPTAAFPRWIEGPSLGSVGSAAGTSTAIASAQYTLPATGLSVTISVTNAISLARKAKHRVQNVQTGKRWPLAIYGTPVLTGTVSTAYAGFQAARIGGAPPVTFSVVGSWPAGIIVNATTGVVSGTPTSGGTFTGLSVRATDSSETPVTDDLATFTLAVTG